MDGTVLQVEVAQEGQGADEDTKQWGDLAILDSCCQANVTGTTWAKNHRRCHEGRKKRGTKNKRKTFFFGDGTKVAVEDTIGVPITTCREIGKKEAREISN